MSIKVKLLEPIKGYEDVATYRTVMVDDTYLTTDGRKLICRRATPEMYRLVLTPTKPYPTPWTFHTGWVAMDDDGEWNWFTEKPYWRGNVWQGTCMEHPLTKTHPDWTPPTHLSAENSLQKVNPQKGSN